jgi:hypothetical protein
MHIKFWSENLEGRGHVGDFGIGGRISKQILETKAVKVGTRFNWLGIWSNGRILHIFRSLRSKKILD